MNPQQAPAPGGAQAYGNVPAIRGVSLVTSTQANPIILVIAPEKAGKSTLGTTLVGWPEPGKQPLYIPFDESGPNSCLKLGYVPHRILPSAFPGQKLWDRTRALMNELETNVATIRQNYGAIIVDCASTMVDKLHEDARRFSGNPDPRSHFGDCLMQSKEFMNRLCDLGLPTIWLAWLRESEMIETKTATGGKNKKLVMGGPQILGSFRQMLAGKSHHILILEKQKIGVGQQGADEDGYVRLFHTRPWENINAGGRYSHVLPEPMFAHLGMVLTMIRDSNTQKSGA